MGAQVVALALMAAGLVVAVALWPPGVARAAPAAGCIAGIPADLATQLQPFIQALAEATDQMPSCASIQSDASGPGPPSQRPSELELIAETMALLALADPGYSYAPPGYGYAAPSYGDASPEYGYPAIDSG